MHADLVEVEEMVEQAHVPVGGAARADMAEHLRVFFAQMLRADRRHRAGAHVGDDGGVEDRARHAGARIEQVQDAEFRRQAVLVVVDVVADDLDAGRIERRDVAAQHVEMAMEGRVGLEMDARLDHRLAVALGDQPRLDRVDDFGIGHRQRLDVERVEIVDVDGRHAAPKSFDSMRPIYYGQAARRATAARWLTPAAQDRPAGRDGGEQVATWRTANAVTS